VALKSDFEWLIFIYPGQMAAPTLGETIRRLRRASGLSQKELADAAGLSP